MRMPSKNIVFVVVVLLIFGTGLTMAYSFLTKPVPTSSSRAGDFFTTPQDKTLTYKYQQQCQGDYTPLNAARNTPAFTQAFDQAQTQCHQGALVFSPKSLFVCYPTLKDAQGNPGLLTVLDANTFAATCLQYYRVQASK
jgi:hypothetical protein